MMQPLAEAMPFWEHALAEGLGGAAVALIVIVYERGERRRSAKDRFDRSRFAVLTELRSIRKGLGPTELREQGDDRLQRPLHSSPLRALVQISMEGIGKPDLEAGVGAISDEIDNYNNLLFRLLAESSGVSRAMGDLSIVTGELEKALTVSSGTVARLVDDFIRLIEVSKHCSS